MAESLSLSAVGLWLKEHWWQSAAAGVVVVGLSLWCLLGGRAQVTGDTPEARAESIRVIAADRPAGAVEAIVAVVHDPNPIVRERAIASLAELQARPDLVRAAIHDPDQNVRVTAAVVLVDVVGPAVVPVLAEVAFDEKADDATRRAALRGLARANTPEAAAHLSRAMDVAKPKVAQAAMEGLTGMLGLRWWNSPPDPADPKEWARKKAILMKVRFIPRAKVSRGG